MAIWRFDLDCLADEGTDSVPVYAVRPEGLAAFLEEVPEEAASFLRGSGFSAREGSVALVPGRNGVKGAVLGLGDAVGPAPFGALPFGLPEGVVCRFAGPLDSPEDAVLGFCLGAYRFSQLKTRQERAPARLVPPASCGNARALASSAWFVRDLINLPANLLGPRELAEAAVGALEPFGALVEVMEGETLSSSYPMVAAVGAGSTRPPLVVRARVGAADPSAKLISLVGKGVCFDSGGYDLKPSSGMQRMKKDMAGAAIALGVARLLLACRVPVRLELRLGCVENSVSGSAMRPLDVLRSRRGLTVAVANTDAEGRLVLADLLAEASDAEPDMLLNFATLTGAARTALGPDIAALFSNDDDLAADIETAARAAHESVWRMPLHDAYDFYLDGVETDLKNISDKPYAGAVMAALFLRRFLAPGTKWAHFDLFGWNETTRPGRPEGGEAQCMRTVFELIARGARHGDLADESGRAAGA